MSGYRPTAGLVADVAAAFKELNERRAAMGDRRIARPEEAQERIAFHVREIEMLCDAYDFDPGEWLVEPAPQMVSPP